MSMAFEVYHSNFLQPMSLKKKKKKKYLPLLCKKKINVAKGT